MTYTAPGLSHMPAEALQQNQTLSLRISEALLKRLEDIRKLRAGREGESVSTISRTEVFG